ncbi:hypothetical protein HZ994_05465 [Akkermansiaceae bacterium]|nr:hypothetical protein HZ994_05465 [Akkermansiaceae bacterium]
MKMNRIVLFGFVAGISALAVSSCAYDPYYSSSYGGGYGAGYGYGGSSFSTSYFVSTGSPRWGYDPYAGAYYDYTRRCYYDPHLYGYYPIGYRPRYVVGAPHPHGWSRGSSYCPPPSTVRSYTLTNYQNRSERYRSLGRSWSSNVSVTSPGRDQRGYNNSDWMHQRSSDGGRRGVSGSYYGSGIQRPAYDDRRSSSSSAFPSRSGDFSRGGSTQPGGFTRPDFGSRESSGASRGFGGSGRGGSAPSMNPAFSRDQGAGSGSAFGDRPAAPQRSVAPAPQAAPQFERRGESPGGGRGARPDSGRGEGREIRGLGEG